MKLTKLPRKKKQLNIRISEAELKDWASLANDLQMPVSEMVRTLVNTHIGRVMIRSIKRTRRSS